MLHYLEWNKVVYEAERRRKPVIRYQPENEYVNEFKALAEAIESNEQLHIPNPMGDSELDVFLEELFKFKQ